MKCNKCNQIIPDDSEFCQYCGNKIETKETSREAVEKNGAKVLQGVPDGFAFSKLEEKRTNPNNIIHNTPKTNSKEKKLSFISPIYLQ